MSRLSTVQPLPARRRTLILGDMPPHVAARGIEQLDLEIVDGAASAQPQVARVLARHGRGPGAPRDHEALAALEIEVHAQGLAAAEATCDRSSVALPETVGCHADQGNRVARRRRAHQAAVPMSTSRTRSSAAADSNSSQMTVRSSLSCALTALIKQARLRPRRLAS